ncbi:MAG TPA: hypothetical protein VMI31_08640, partial [Fimbriimonadaceae bacterium]|nr:hypothetical protein [Fimbriimonadaceae bacterium]
LPDDGASFVDGEIGGLWKRYLEAPGTVRVDRTPPACIVVLMREPTWIDRSLDAVRRLLHL